MAPGWESGSLEHEQTWLLKVQGDSVDAGDILEFGAHADRLLSALDCLRLGDARSVAVDVFEQQAPNNQDARAATGVSEIAAWS